MSYDEVEFKYDARNISIESFHKLCKKFNPSAYLEQYGTDTFYYCKHIEQGFCRHRIGNDINQLTYKEKTCTENSVIRREVNVDLEKNTKENVVSTFLNYQGYTKQNTIGKASFVYLCNDHVMAYYVCYDNNMKELGRFIEIEIREDKELGTADDKFTQLVVIEKLCKSLGIKPKDRVNSSLFELYGLDKEK